MSGIRKVLICSQHGGFGLSRAAFLRLRELGQPDALREADYGERWSDGSGPREPFGRGGYESFGSDIPRDDPLLLQVFGELRDAASGTLCRLELVEIPDDVSWHIEEYNGAEWVAEDHRTWGN